MSFRIRHVSKCTNRLYQLIPLSKTWSYSEWGQQTYSKGISLPLKRNVFNKVIYYLHSKFAIITPWTHSEIIQVTDNVWDICSQTFCRLNMLLDVRRHSYSNTFYRHQCSLNNVRAHWNTILLCEGCMFVNACVCTQECKLLSGKISKLWIVEVWLYIVENFPSKHI